jgi:hypothetical protein
MSELSEVLGDGWDVVRDLVFHDYGKCYNCQPYDGGEPVWIVPSTRLVDAATEVVDLAADVNGISLPDGWEELVAKAIDDDDDGWHCDDCGTELTADDEIGENVFDEGADPAKATHLLTQAHWPFLTHYVGGDTADAARARFESVLSDRVLRASTKFITGSHEVVCLTECSPPEIRELLRVSHAVEDSFDERARWSQLGHEKMRWARSTWGFAFNRPALVAAGARPALHGDEALYAALPASEKFRFVRFEHAPRFADWTFEREFRFPGDIPLDGLLAGKMFLVVPDRRERMRLLARIDVPPWPVMPFDLPLGPNDPVPRPTGRQSARLVHLLA